MRDPIRHFVPRLCFFLSTVALISACASDTDAPHPEREGELGLDPAIVAIMRQQELARPAVDLLRSEMEAGHYAGATNVGFDDEGTGVALWWKGELPEPMRAALVRAEAIAPVTVVPARFSRVELMDAYAKVGETMQAHPELGIASVTVLGDGSGLEVGLRAASAELIGKRAAAPSLPELGVPVSAVYAPELDTQASRNNDASPWKAGARLQTSAGGCSAGWAVKSASSGTKYLMTAAHCGSLNSTVKDGAGTTIGTVKRRNQGHDVELIQANAQALMYQGGPTSSSTIKVGGWNGVVPNEYVCESGAYSASTLCGFKVSPSFPRTFCPSNLSYCIYDLFAAKRDDNVTTTGGDSGGPVFIYKSTKVEARGTHTGVSGHEVVFQDFYTAEHTDFSDIVLLTQ